jgi:hypothetical protein
MRRNLVVVVVTLGPAHGWRFLVHAVLDIAGLAEHEGAMKTVSCRSGCRQFRQTMRGWPLWDDTGERTGAEVWGRRSSFNVQKVMWQVGELDLAHDMSMLPASSADSIRRLSLR